MRLRPRYDGPPVIDVEVAPDDRFAPIARQHRRFGTLLASLDPGDWLRPTRCAGWAVRDVVAHLVSVNQFWTMSVIAGVGGVPTRILGGFDPAATPDLLVQSFAETAPAQLLEQFVDASEAMLATLADLDDADWDRVAEAPPGLVAIRTLVQHALWDSWVHERDVAIPLGIATVDEADEIRSALSYAAALSPGLGFGLGLGEMPPTRLGVACTEPDVRCMLIVDECVVVRLGVDDTAVSCLTGRSTDVLDALSLRTPLPDDAPAPWRDVLSGLKTAFDQT
jgi:uncharacterized protein (TIGR03083 family)